MLKTKVVKFDDLTPSQQSCQPDNGCGKECASYLVMTYGMNVIRIESDAMCPEDVRFYRDLSWVEDAINQAYKLGVGDGMRVERMKNARTD